MAKPHAKPELLALKKDIRDIIANFIKSFQEAMGFITEELEHTQKDLDALAAERKVPLKYVDEYLMLGNIQQVTERLQDFILKKIAPSSLDANNPAVDADNPDDNPLYQTLVLFIEKPEFKALEHAHQKIAIIKCEIAPFYCDEKLESVLSKMQNQSQQRMAKELRETIADIVAKENDPTLKLIGIHKAVNATQEKLAGTKAKLLTLFVPHNELEVVLDNFIKNLPKEAPHGTPSQNNSKKDGYGK